jgi:ankyrin repeat protein
LHIAVKNNNNEITKFLIQKGLNISARDESGNSPLKWSIKNNKIKMAELLISLGANKTEFQDKDEDGQTMLHLASKEGDLTAMAFILKNKADINARNYPDNNTALQLAIINKQTKTALALIKENADITVRNEQGDTPLHLAVRNRDFQVTQALILGKADINARNQEGKTPLHLIEFNSKIAQLLISNKADINATDKNGTKPSDFKKAMALIEQGYAFYQAKNDLKAIELYEEALKIQETADGYFKYANSLSNLAEKLSAAIPAYEKALTLGYKAALVHYNLACAYSKMKNTKKAFENLYKAMEKGYENFTNLRKDEDLIFLHDNHQWQDILAKTERLYQGICTGDNVNVREGKGLDFPVIDSLKKGDKVDVLEVEKENSGEISLLKDRFRVKLGEEIIQLEKGKGMIVMERNPELVKVKTEVGGKTIAFFLHPSNLIDIQGFVKVKTPSGQIGWTVLKYIAKK